MAFDFGWGNVSSGVTNPELVIYDLDFPKNFVGQSEADGTSITYRDFKVPVEQRATERITIRPRTNMYKGAGIAPARQLASTDGMDIVHTTKAVGSTLEDGVEKYAPFEIVSTIRAPRHNNVTPEDLLALLRRHLSVMLTGLGTGALTDALDLYIHEIPEKVS